MNRLTNKYCNNYDDFISSFRSSLITGSELRNEIYKKLKQLEDIEEELGIDLTTLFKALKNGVYVVCGDYIEFVENYKLSLSLYRKELIVMNDCMSMIKFEDYGKTWALTREELEDEK